MEIKEQEDDIGYFDDYTQQPDLEVFEAAVQGFPNAVSEAIKRELVTRQELIDNEIIER